MLVATDAELLTLVNTEIANRLNGGGFHKYSTGVRSFEGATLIELMQLKRNLERSTALTNPAVLIQPVTV